MTLLDIVKSLSELEPMSTIFAVEPWTNESRAFLLPLPEPGNVADLPRTDLPLDGAIYFLEVFIALEVLEGVFKWKPNLSIEEYCAELIYYAIHDAPRRD